MIERRHSRPPVVLLAAGNGSRLITADMDIPKPLYQVDGVPLLDHVLDRFMACGFRRFCLVVGFRADRIAQHVRAHRQRGIEVDLVLNPDFHRDNGLSVLASLPKVDGHFVLGMADHVFEPTLLDRLVEAGPEPDGITLAVDRKRHSVFDLPEATKARVEGDRVLRVDKGLTEFDAVDTGLFYAGAALFQALEACRTQGRTKLADGVNALAAAGRVRAVDVGPGRWIDVDTPEAAAEMGKWIHLDRVCSCNA
jgi:1L-myo-inositol 1-phosphate cytidylyltransferase